MFSDGEAVRLVLADPAAKKLFYGWRAVTDRPYGLSLAYVAQGVGLD